MALIAACRHLAHLVLKLLECADVRDTAHRIECSDWLGTDVFAPSGDNVDHRHAWPHALQRVPAHITALVALDHDGISLEAVIGCQRPFDQRTTTTAYVFGVVPYLQHDEFGTRLDWRGVCLGGVSTAVFSLLLVRVPRKRKDPGEVGRA